MDPVAEEPLIHIHEDDWGMRNLYPLAARSDVARDMDTAIDASERNRAPDGLGWTKVHVIEPPSFDYEAAGLSLERVAARLGELMPRVPRFNATAGAGFSGHDRWGSYETEAYCFGFDASCYVKVDPVESGGIVKAIWYECRTPDTAKRTTLRLALEAVDRIVPSVVADYWLNLNGPVGDPDFLVAYFAELGDVSDVSTTRRPKRPRFCFHSHASRRMRISEYPSASWPIPWRMTVALRSGGREPTAVTPALRPSDPAPTPTNEHAGAGGRT